MSTRESLPALDALTAEIRASAWDLAAAAVEEGLVDDQIPSLQRLGELGQLGDMPTFIAELSLQLSGPQPERLRRGSELAAQAREHARERESLGFSPREIVTEFLILRRILWRFVAERTAELEPADVLEAQERLNAAVDRVVAECVIAYFDRATLELSHQARHDQLTGLLHHQAFVEELSTELERAARYDHGVSLVFIDLDRFKELNDTLGHPAGDRTLKRFAALLRDSLRGSDLAGRMGGDELVTEGKLPVTCSFSAGLAHFPDEAADADALFRVADERLYEAKRASAA